MKNIYTTEECLSYMMDTKNIIFNSDEEKKLFLDLLNIHGVNNVITVYKHYFCTDKIDKEHLYGNKINCMEYKAKLERDMGDAPYIWEKIIVLERIFKNELYEQYIKEIPKKDIIKSIDLYKYIEEKCDNKIKMLDSSKRSNYYMEIKKLIEKNINSEREFYFLIKELSWSNILTLVELLKKPRKNEFFTKIGINIKELNQIRILRNSLAHGDYITIYLNKQVYDGDAYEKLNVINMVRKIFKKYNTESEESNKEFSKMYIRNIEEFSERRKYI